MNWQFTNKFKNILFLLPMILLIIGCKEEKRWEVEPEQIAAQSIDVEFLDVSSDFFNTEIDLDEFRNKYPFFLDPEVPNEKYESQRRDTLELAVFDTVQKRLSNSNYKEELKEVFGYLNHYFPLKNKPVVITYSSFLSNIYEPAAYRADEEMLAIALDGFMGSDSHWYMSERVYPYMAKNMNPENIAPMAVHAIADQYIPLNPQRQSFIDLIVDEGKHLIMADALLPDTPDYLKIGYTPEELKWAEENEGNIWNFFVEENLIFESDKTYRERFIDPAPYSKFLNEIETESPGRVGIWIGWQICRKYLNRHPDVSLQNFLRIDNQEVFKESKYKPGK